MTDRNYELTDELLGAFADGELDEMSRSRLEKALGKNAEARRRLKAIRDVSMLVRAATRVGTERSGHDPAVALPKPSGRVAQRLPLHRLSRHWTGWRVAAAFAGGAIIAVLATAYVWRPTAPSGEWAQHALAFHAGISRGDQDSARATFERLIDLQPNELSTAAQIADYEPVLPDLSAHGYEPLGARLMTTPRGMVTFVIFAAPNQPLLGYSMARRTADVFDDFRFDSRRDINLVTWSSGEHEFALTGQLPTDALTALAETARQTLASPTAL